MPYNYVGLNLQTLPPRMKPFVKFDKDYLGFDMDLKQAEYIEVANFAPEPSMLQALNNGVDPHNNTYALMFDIPVESVSDELGSSDIGDGTKSQRFWGKQCNHALNYDLGPNQFADRFELPVAQAKMMLSKYHSVFPGIRFSYHRKVQKLISEGRTIVNPYGRSRTFLGRIDAQLYKQAYAHTPQSTVADHILRYAFLPAYYDEEFRGIELLLQVHDSIVFQMHKSLGFLYMAERLLKLKASMETPVPSSDWCESFVIPVDCQAGHNYGKKGLKDTDLTKPLPAIATRLEEVYNSVPEELS